MASLFIKVSKYLFILYILIFLLCGFIAVLRRKITVRQYTTASNIQRLMTLLFNLQFPDILFGAGLCHTPLVFLLFVVFLFDEHYLPAVGADRFFSVLREFHSPSA